MTPHHRLRVPTQIDDLLTRTADALAIVGKRNG